MISLLSFILKLISSTRNYLYDNNFFKIKSINIPIISVGNLELGGTGKTPTVLFLAKFLSKNNYNPGIVSRGYKRSSSGQQLVTDGKKIFLSVKEAGDEPFLLAQNLKNIPIVVNKDRFFASNYLKSKFNVNIILLDDAFQHRNIKRDIDILLINTNTPIKNLNLFPSGVLRENFNNYRRASVLLLCDKIKSNEPINNFYKKIRFKNKFSCYFVFDLYCTKTFSYLKPKEIKENVFAFCGIGNPNSFFKTLQELNIKSNILKAFKDHQKYNRKVVDNIIDTITKNNIYYVITTEKDYIKLPKFFTAQFRIIILKLALETNVNFENYIIKKLNSL